MANTEQNEGKKSATMKLNLQIGYEINLPSYNFDRLADTFQLISMDMLLWSFSISFHPTKLSYLPPNIWLPQTMDKRKIEQTNTHNRNWTTNIYSNSIYLFILRIPSYAKLNVFSNKYPEEKKKSVWSQNDKICKRIEERRRWSE